MVFYYPKKRIKDLKISFIGKLKKNELFLNEKYEDNDDIVYRYWRFEKISKNTFYGLWFFKQLIRVHITNNIINSIIKNQYFRIACFGK